MGLFNFRSQSFAVFLTIVLGLGIAWGTLFPLEELPPAPGSDKLHHLLAFGIFVLPISVLNPKRTWLIFLVGVFYGGMIELIQPYVNRYREIGDFWANTTGAVLGVLLARLIILLRARKDHSSQ